LCSITNQQPKIAKTQVLDLESPQTKANQAEEEKTAEMIRNMKIKLEAANIQIERDRIRAETEITKKFTKLAEQRLEEYPTEPSVASNRIRILKEANEQYQSSMQQSEALRSAKQQEQVANFRSALAGGGSELPDEYSLRPNETYEQAFTRIDAERKRSIAQMEAENEQNQSK
jgi:hypothetical protein